MRDPITTPLAVLQHIWSAETGPTSSLKITSQGLVVGHDHAGRETVRMYMEGPKFVKPTADQIEALRRSARAAGYTVRTK